MGPQACRCSESGSAPAAGGKRQGAHTPGGCPETPRDRGDVGKKAGISRKENRARNHDGQEAWDEEPAR